MGIDGGLKSHELEESRISYAKMLSAADHKNYPEVCRYLIEVVKYS